MNEADVLDEKLRSNPIDDLMLQDMKKQHMEHPSDSDVTMTFSLALMRSERAAEREEAKHLLRHLMNPLYRGKYNPEAAMHLAQLYYQEGALDEALRMVEDLWRSNPDHPQIANLHKAVKYRHQQKQQEEERRKEDIMTGVGGALLLVGAVVLGGVFAKKR